MGRIFQRFHWPRTKDGTYSFPDATRGGACKYICKWVASGRRHFPFIANLEENGASRTKDRYSGFFIT
jgi:hypothetical protein